MQILSGDLVAHERSVSLTYGRPVESWSSLEQMYFLLVNEGQTE